ncbi:MAG TPA: Mpo1-like protein [Polyangiales bacterium]
MTELDRLLEEYERDHQHPVNRALHLLGITLIGSSVAWAWLPPVALSAFSAGWAAQLLGHRIEGNRPSFTREPRLMAVGAVWYVRTLRRLAARAA